jgi:REP element-mobilizing transposase RayT
MGRHRRPNLPGGIFHLTARTLQRERLFTPPLRSAALELLAGVVPGSGARLLAVAIMPNHLHLVAQQGDRPIAGLMQPLLRRLAHLLQRSHGREGPVFWRPFACRACLGPGHVRNAIVYTHLNPVRANLCTRPSRYAWTSHPLYSEPTGGGAMVPVTTAARLARVLDPEHALPLFATRHDRRPDQLRDDYRRFVSWRLTADRVAEAVDRRTALIHEAPPERPPLAWGDLHWGNLSPLFHSATMGGDRLAGAPRYRPDLSDLARGVLATEAPGITLELVRGRSGGATYGRVRARLIRAMHAAGHRNVDIARFLRLSESAVSKVICTARRA